jgi:hypothetical protein
VIDFEIGSKYSYEPVISCLEAVCLFSGFKAYPLQTGEAVQSGPRLKPCKRQTASAARHRWQLQSTMDVTDHRVLLLETICVSPVVFLAFAARETPAPERSEGERGGSHAYKGLRKQGARACWKKKHPVIGYQWTTDGFTEYLQLEIGKRFRAPWAIR